MKIKPSLITDRGTTKLLNANALLETLFDEKCRPSMRSLRTWTANRIIPCVRLGGLIFYDPEQVKAALVRRTVKER